MNVQKMTDAELFAGRVRYRPAPALPVRLATGRPVAGSSAVYH
jgi:hypothetical protein